MQAKILDRNKKRNTGMMPPKVWFSLVEASEWMDLSTDTFERIALANGLTICKIERKKFYKIAEINEVFEKFTIIKKVN